MKVLKVKKRSALVAAISTVGGISSLAFGDVTWVGGTAGVPQDWNTVANWTANPNGQTLQITTGTGNYPIITSTSTFTPVDIRIGPGSVGRLDQIAGTAGTGNGNYLYLGYSAGTATFNLAGTNASGGAYTGFGQGTGSFNVGGTTTNGNLLIGLDNGTTSTVNVNTTGTLAAGTIFVGGAGSSSGTLNLDSGTVTSQNDIEIGGHPFNNPATAAGNNSLNVSGGTITGNTIVFSRGVNNGSTSVGKGNFTGGTINSRAWFTLGFAGNGTAQGIVTNSGGTININTGAGNGPCLEMGTFDSAGALFNQNSGSVNLLTNAIIGFGNGGNNNGVATFNQNGGNVNFYSDGGTTPGGTGGIVLGVGGSSGTYTYNLGGGTLTVPTVKRVSTGGTGTFNFNGGTLKAASTTTTFMNGLSAANVLAGGAIIDSNGQNVTIGQSLLTGVAGDGGLTKNGAGVLTLTGSSTYTGATTVNAGTLALSTAGSINGTSAITLNGGATLLQLSSTPLTQPITVASGTVDGVGSVGSATFNSSLSNVLTSGNGGVGQLSINALTFNGAATAKLFTSLASNTSAGIVTNTLATGATAGAIKINVVDTDTAVANGVYDLLAYNSSTGAGFNAFSLGTVAGISGRQVATLTNITGSVNYVALNVTGVAGAIVWSGTTNGNWTTTTSAQNWKLNGSATSFVTGDNVLFDDTATGTTNISITDATVAPSAVNFNNSSLSYSISGPGAITGATSIKLNGTGAVSLNNSNSYTGGTTLNAGTLNINNAGALSTGTLAINGGTIDNTSAGPVTLSSNTPQSWNSNFTYKGTQPLNTGAGAVALTSNVTVTTTASNLTVGGNVTGPGFGLTKEGPGALTLAGTTGYTGNTSVNAGTLNVNNTLSTPGNLYMSSTGGASVLNVAGTASHAFLLMGNSSGGTAAVYVTGNLVQSGGSSLQGFNLGNVTGSYGYMALATGGTISSGDQNIGSFNGGDGLLELNGGTINNNGWLTTSRNQTVATQNSAVNINGGTYNYAGGGVVANWGGQQTTVINVQGGKLATTNNSIINLNQTGNVTNQGVLNLNGGVVQPSNIAGTGAVVNFNGGTLRANSANANFIAVGSAYVYGGGAVIDTNGNNITIAQPLLAPTGAGVTAPTVASGGSGYVAPPLVTVSPGSGDTTGTGATAMATINRTTGQLTGITITNPGVGYTAPPVFNLVDSGGATTPASINSNAPVANVGGGLTKTGAGVLSLKSPSTYTGPTVINGGTLQIVGAPVAALVASYSFDNTTATPVGVPTTIPNSGSGGATLNGVVAQSTVNGTNAVQIVAGGPNINGNGGSGNALNFDGTGGSVNIPSGITDLSGTGSWTVSAWVQTSQTGSTIFSKNTNGSWAPGNSVYYFGNTAVGGGTIPSAVRNSGGFISSSTPVTDGNWHMVTYVDVAGVKTIYVDGVADAMTQTGFTTADVGNQIQLGFSSDTIAGDGTGGMLGSMDNINFYSGALTAGQVANLYNTSNAGLAPPPANILPATTAVVLLNSGSALDLNGNAQTIGSLNGSAGTAVILGGGTLTVGDSTSTTYAGNITDAGGGSTQVGGGLIKQGAGTLTLSGTNAYSGATTVNAGSLVLTAASALPAGTSLQIVTGASTIFAAHATGNAGMLQVTQLQLSGSTNAWTGKLDLNNNGMDVANGSLANISNQVKQGYNNGKWNGSNGIISTTASTNTTHLTALGVLLNDNGSGVPFYGVGGGIASSLDGIVPATGDVLVKYTYYGDTNLDGKVDGTDYSRIDNGYLSRTSASPKTGWYNGDFNYDGLVNGSDYTLMDNAYNTQGAQLAAQLASPTASVTASIGGAGGGSSVPEPASLGILAIGAAGLLGRRTRNRHAN